MVKLLNCWYALILDDDVVSKRGRMTEQLPSHSIDGKLHCYPRSILLLPAVFHTELYAAAAAAS